MKKARLQNNRKVENNSKFNKNPNNFIDAIKLKCYTI